MFIHSVHPTNALLYELYRYIFRNLNINIDNYSYNFTDELLGSYWCNPMTTKMVNDLNITFNTKIDDEFYINRYNSNKNNRFDSTIFL